MKAQPHELNLLHIEGYTYKLKPRRGWYFKGEWVGYNTNDCFDHREKREGETDVNSHQSKVKEQD